MGEIPTFLNRLEWSLIDLCGTKSLHPEFFNKDLVEIIVTILTTPIVLSTPIAIAIACYISIFKQNLTILDKFIFIWCMLEPLFHLYCWKLYPILSANSQKSSLTHENRQLLKKSLIEEGHLTTKVVADWFNPKRDETVTFSEAKIWLAWFFFGRLVSKLTSEEDKELEDIAKSIELNSGVKFLDKRIGLPRLPMLLTLDPVCFQHKPLILFLIVRCVKLFGRATLRLLGYQHKQLNFGYSYWIYEPTISSTSKPPILFIHGIGIGVSMYAKKAYDLTKLYPNQRIILLDLNYISLSPLAQIHSQQPTLEALDQLFTRHNIQACSFIGHSYGTFLCSWVMKHRPQYITKMMLVDPVCFNLWESDLIKNFVYSGSNSFMHRICQFFIARDLFIANTIQRNAFWHDNILLGKDIVKPTKVIVSRYDFLINAPNVYNYLSGCKKNSPNLDLEVEMVDDQTHGTYLISKYILESILDCV